MEDLEYDFYISANGRLVIPEFNIDYLISFAESNISNIPTVRENTVEIAGRDGDMVLSSKYEPREFQLVVYTEDNLTQLEKQKEIDKVAAFLHSVKKSPKKMAILYKDRMYEVRTHDKPTVENFPKFVKFSIPLKSSDAFSSSLNKSRLSGNQTKASNTVEDTGCIITIIGAADHPRISLNGYEMFYDNMILDGNKIIIDTKNSTITHETYDGVKTNAAKYYNHEYPKIKNGDNKLEVLSGVKYVQQVTVEWYDLKY